MNKISMDKKYTSRNKEWDCEILCINLNNDYPIVVKCTRKKDNHQCVRQHKANGRYYSDVEESCFDLIEVSPYADFKIDEKVIVWDSASSIKLNRHFAGISDSGKPMAFAEGMTSFTADCRKTDWDNCELYKEE